MVDLLSIYLVNQLLSLLDKRFILLILRLSESEPRLSTLFLRSDLLKLLLCFLNLVHYNLLVVVLLKDLRISFCDFRAHFNNLPAFFIVVLSCFLNHILLHCYYLGGKFEFLFELGSLLV